MHASLEKCATDADSHRNYIASLNNLTPVPVPENCAVGSVVSLSVISWSIVVLVAAPSAELKCQLAQLN